MRPAIQRICLRALRARIRRNSVAIMTRPGHGCSSPRHPAHQAETATLVHHEGILKLTKRDAVLLTVLPVELNQGELSLIHEMGDGPAVHLQELHGCPEAAEPMVG